MTDFDVIAALEAHAGEWPGLADTPIQWDGQPNGNYDDSWLRMTVLPGNPLIKELGTIPMDRRTGVCTFQVFTREGTGWGEAYRLADSIGQHMAYQSIESVETFAYGTDRVGVSNGWYQVNVTINYRTSRA